MERPRVFTADILIAASMTAASLGLMMKDGREPRPRCDLATTEVPAKDNADMSFQDMASGILDTEFTTKDDYLKNDYAPYYADILGEAGIKVTEQDGQGKHRNTWLFELATMPKSIVTAAELKEIIVTTKFDIVDDKPFPEPKHDKHTLWLDNAYQLERGLAAMIMDNYCDTGSIIAEMTRLTEMSGNHYDTDAQESNQVGRYDAWKQQYGDTFDAWPSMRSAREEFISLMSDNIRGYAWQETDITNSLGLKRELVRRIFDSIEPNGEAWQGLQNYGAAIGTHDLPPLRLLYRIQCINDQLDNAKTKAERSHIIGVDSGEEAPDAAVKDCDDPPELRRPPGVLPYIA